jgi:hypothetical protein
MHKELEILGDGQIWDLKGISPNARRKTFEDLFSGRALGQMAYDFNQHLPPQERIFSRFKEKGKITGLSVTKALLSNNQKAKKTARIILKDLAKNAALGITCLNKGEGFKKNWTVEKKNYWKNLNFVIIGGGVSEDATGKILVGLIKKYLSKSGLSNIAVYQGKFPGKEAGFLGAVINIMQEIRQEGEARGLKSICGIGLDLGREEIGVGLVKVNLGSGEIQKQRRDYWVFKSSTKSPEQSYLKHFLDTRKGYTQSEKMKGERFRLLILELMAKLIIQAKNYAQKKGLSCARSIGVAVPGSTTPQGYIMNSTDYLPFFRKQDGFNFAKSLERVLVKRLLQDCRIYIINDGIAAGIANAYFDLSRVKKGKFAFFGVGSGLGGCVGQIRTR